MDKLTPEFNKRQDNILASVNRDRATLRGEKAEIFDEFIRGMLADDARRKKDVSEKRDITIARGATAYLSRERVLSPFGGVRERPVMREEVTAMVQRAQLEGKLVSQLQPRTFREQVMKQAHADNEKHERQQDDFKKQEIYAAARKLLDNLKTLEPAAPAKNREKDRER